MGNPRYDPLLASGNAFDKWTGASNFRAEVLPLLEDFAASGREVMWLGGDSDPKSGIRYLCTGIGDQAWDNVIELSLPPKGPIGIEVLALTPNPLPPLSECGPDDWALRFPEWRKRLPELSAE